jgi:hypothetical protein
MALSSSKAEKESDLLKLHGVDAAGLTIAEGDEILAAIRGLTKA